MSPHHHEQTSGKPKRREALAAVCLLSFLVLVGPSLAIGGPVHSLQEIRQDGVIIQKWDTSCGAAALATVLTYSLKEPVSEREVATGMLRMTEPIKVKHQGGFSLLDMKHFVETRGLTGTGYRDLTFEQLITPATDKGLTRVGTPPGKGFGTQTTPGRP